MSHRVRTRSAIATTNEMPQNFPALITRPLASSPSPALREREGSGGARSRRCCHCEEWSDEAISMQGHPNGARLLHYARNDNQGYLQGKSPSPAVRERGFGGIRQSASSAAEDAGGTPGEGQEQEAERHRGCPGGAVEGRGDAFDDADQNGAGEHAGEAGHPAEHANR